MMPAWELSRPVSMGPLRRELPVPQALPVLPVPQVQAFPDAKARVPDVFQGR